MTSSATVNLFSEGMKNVERHQKRNGVQWDDAEKSYMHFTPTVVKWCDMEIDFTFYILKQIAEKIWPRMWENDTHKYMEGRQNAISKKLNEQLHCSFAY